MFDGERVERLLTLEKGNSLLVVDPKGSRIYSLFLLGRSIAAEFTRGDGSVGSWHPCGPNFESDTAGFGLPRHGTLRNDMATRISGEPGEHSIRTSTMIMHQGYPAVQATRAYTLRSNSLSVDTEYLNRGDTPALVNHAEHLYLKTPHGWQGTQLNDRSIDEEIRGDEIFPWGESNVLKINGQERLLITQYGLSYANPWVWRDDKQEFFDNEYFCLSAIQGNPRQGFFGSKESLIQPGESRSFRLVICVPPQR